MRFEEASNFEVVWDGIESRLGAHFLQAVDIRPHRIQRLAIFDVQSGLHERRRDVITMNGRKVLRDLLAATMAVQVPPAADVHKDIEGECVARAELSRQLV